MDDLLAEFLAETHEMLEAVGGELVAWEADPADKARLDAIFRFVHTVKGNCGFFDFPRLETLSHAAEDALADVRSGQRSATPQLVTGVLRIIDRIGEMADAIEAGEQFALGGDDALIAALAADPDDDNGMAHSTTTGAEGGGSARGSAANGQRSIRLPVALLDDVMSCASDLVLARNDLARPLHAGGVDPATVGRFERLSTLVEQMREAVTRMRMQRIEHLFGALPRMVRDISAELGRQVMVDMEGGDVELDREMIEMIRDPITHIVRNAIDHGIETPAERRAAGKREIGTLLVTARHRGNRVMIAITDDGRGIDGARLVERAVQAGRLDRAEAALLEERDRLALVFEPGLSTADAVTRVSGRGVGMDVVRANIERIGGSIEVTSDLGQGTHILLNVPLTLSIIPSLTVTAGGQTFALPRSYVEEIVSGRAAHVEFAAAGDATLVTVRGKRIACLSLARALGLDGGSPFTRAILLLVRLAGGDLFALAVDGILDHEERVIKPLAPAIMELGVFAGSTLLDDGHPVLMLDIAGIARAAGLVGEVGRGRRGGEDEAVTRADPAVQALLFTGLDGTRRLIRLGSVRRIERIAVSAIDCAADPPQAVLGDSLVPLAGLEGGTLPDHQVSVLRLGDGQCEIAYAIGAIEDTVDLAGAIAPARRAGASEGTALVGGKPVDVVDGHWLFATYASPPRTIRAPVCRLPADDQWARAILAPLIESAGYRVVGPDFEGEADVFIASEAQPVTDSAAGSAVITLCADPARAGQAPGVLYRYDRAGLVAALAALRGGRAA